MNRKTLSLIVILCTIICVSIMMFFNKVNTNENSMKDKVQVLNKKDINKKDISNDLKNNSENSKCKDKLDNKDEVAVTDSYKKNKMDTIENSIDEDKKEFFSQYDTKDNKKDTTNNEVVDKTNADNNSSINTKDNKNNCNGKETPVFKVSRSQIKDSLTLLDKEKLLSVASKLSAVDYEKIKEYLQDGSDDDMKSTIKLLKERLSDKDYEKVKEVAQKFINMEAINQ